MAKVKDYYEVLGVDRKATAKEVQSAFRKLARQHHPDVNQGDKASEAKFKEASEAHDVLSDPEKRKLYDQYGHQWQAAKAAGATGDGPPSAGAQRGGRTTSRSFSQDDLDDLFGGRGVDDLFGGIFRGRTGARRPAPDFEGAVPITLREAYAGTTRQVTLADGRTLEVKVPAGVAEGTILKVPGLRARVEILPDPLFQRDGKDLRVPVTVPLRACLLGGEVEVPTIKGTRVQLKVPAETQNGTRLRMRGLGMPDPKGGTPGDLLAEVYVRLPLPVDEKLRNLAEELPE